MLKISMNNEIEMLDPYWNYRTRNSNESKMKSDIDDD